MLRNRSRRPSPRAFAAAVVPLLLLAVIGPGGASPAAAVPPPPGPFTFLRCKFSDHPEVPYTDSDLNNQLVESESRVYTHSIPEWFRASSRGRLRMRDNVISPWFTMSVDRATSAAPDYGRAHRIQDCIDAARAAGFTPDPQSHVVALVNAQVDSGAQGRNAYLDPLGLRPRFAVHELLHALGLDHSYSNDLDVHRGSHPGGYDDPWDEMSAENVYGSFSAFGASAVGLNGHHLDELGWLPRSAVRTAGSTGVTSAYFQLGSLDRDGFLPSQTGPAASTDVQLVRVPFDAKDLHHYYTVEYRTPDGPSLGIPAARMLIHEVKNGTPTLIRDLSTPGHPPATSLVTKDVTIRRGGIAPAGRISVLVRTEIVRQCLDGYVPRQATATDQVCVTPALQAQAQADNAAAEARHLPGSTTCRSGYVWREAQISDLVCVLPTIRSRAALDNALAPTRVNPARLVKGPNTCAHGYTWRASDDSDYVCVTAAVAQQVAQENADAARYWKNPADPAAGCLAGRVPRDAFYADRVCVLPDSRDRARQENRTAGERVE